MHYTPYLCYKSLKRNIKSKTIFLKPKDPFFRKKWVFWFSKNRLRFYISLQGFIAYIRYIVHMVGTCQHYIPHAFVRLSGSPMRSYSICPIRRGGVKNRRSYNFGQKKKKLRSEILIICLGNMYLNV